MAEGFGNGQVPDDLAALIETWEKELSTKGHQGVEVNRDGIPRSRKDFRLFHSRLIRPAGRGGTYLKDRAEIDKMLCVSIK